MKTIKKQLAKKFKINLEKPILALCPGAEFGPAKRWPAEHFAEIVKRADAAGFTVCLFGGPKDIPISESIQEKSGNVCCDLTGKTSLTDAVDLLGLAQTVITNDSGLMHVACALKKSVVALYGSSSPLFTPPLNVAAKVLSLNLPCSPCFQRTCPLNHTNCLQHLLPERVWMEVSNV